MVDSSLLRNVLTIRAQSLLSCSTLLPLSFHIFYFSQSAWYCFPISPTLWLTAYSTTSIMSTKANGSTRLTGSDRPRASLSSHDVNAKSESVAELKFGVVILTTNQQRWIPYTNALNHCNDGLTHLIIMVLMLLGILVVPRSIWSCFQL